MIQNRELAKKIVWFENREHLFLPLTAGFGNLHSAGTDQKQRIPRCSLSNNHFSRLEIHLPNRDGPQHIRAHISEKTITEECAIHKVNRKELGRGPGVGSRALERSLKSTSPGIGSVFLVRDTRSYID